MKVVASIFINIYNIIDMSIIGKKEKGLDPGYVWAPYIITYDTHIVSYNRFGKSRFHESIQEKRSKKIKKILEYAN